MAESDTTTNDSVPYRGSHVPAEGERLTVMPRVFAESFAVYEELIPQANMGKTTVTESAESVSENTAKNTANGASGDTAAAATL
jgi:hypothetical protein